MTVTAATSAAAGTNQRPPRADLAPSPCGARGLHSVHGHHTEPRKTYMFPGARVLQLSYNEARVCTTVRRAKQRVYTTIVSSVGNHCNWPPHHKINKQTAEAIEETTQLHVRSTLKRRSTNVTFILLSCFCFHGFALLVQISIKNGRSTVSFLKLRT